MVKKRHQSRGALLAAAVLACLAVSSHCAQAKVEFMKVLPEGDGGQSETIVIKNNGDAPQDLKGWSIVDTSKQGANTYWFGGDDAAFKPKVVKWCSNWTALASEQEFTLQPFDRDRFSSSFEPCGFRFKLGFDGQLELRNEKQQAVDRVSWNEAKPGMAVYRMGSTFVPFMENQDLKSSIKSAPVLSTFAKALHATGILDKYVPHFPTSTSTHTHTRTHSLSLPVMGGQSKNEGVI